MPKHKPDGYKTPATRLLDADIRTIRDALSCYCEDCISQDHDAQRKVEQAFDHLIAFAKAGTETVDQTADILRQAVRHDDESRGQELPEDFELNQRGRGQ